jgi:ABC-type Fe3+/spermidine/putrescine transport system ATPase subunit
MMAGFEEPTSGRIYLGDQDITFVPPHKRPANLVFQRYALFPHLSVFENVAFGLRVKKVPEKEVQRRVERIQRSCNEDLVSAR